MYPTMAGCAAMNIHGKNNFKVGTFGDAVQEFDIVLPSGELRTCSRELDGDLFHAAIGGFGMLGCITRVKIQTKRVYSGELEVKGVSVQGLDEMMAYFEAARDDADYLVGWIDCFAGDDDLGRGLVHHARYLPPDADPHPEQTMRVDYQELPSSILGFPKGEVWRVLRMINHAPGMRLLNTAKWTSTNTVCVLLETAELLRTSNTFAPKLVVSWISVTVIEKNPVASASTDSPSSNMPSPSWSMSIVAFGAVIPSM